MPGTIPDVVAPFLSYLRVYEPLRAFEGAAGDPVRAALARGAVPASAAGQRDRELCLRAQLRGHVLPSGQTDVLVTPGPAGQQLVCPLDTRPRAGAALLAFLMAETPIVRGAALSVPESTARRLAEAAVGELGQGAAHVVSASWTVPLPWFALVDPEQRRLRLDPRRVWWQVPMVQARRRAARAETVTRESVGEAGPAEVLAETGAWLERFDRDSVVELDYGGLVDMFDVAALRADTCAAEVHAALRALRDGDSETASACYERLRAFWSVVAGRQRAG